MLILFELLIQSNIEYFTFLGFRSLGTAFSLDFPSKCLIAFGIFMFFLSVLGMGCSYFIYFIQYRKLARYFLVNLFRFPSSYGLMMIIYGLRPFIKGAIHSLFYHNWVLQMWSLMAAEITILLIIAFFEFKFDNHKSKIVFMLDVSYYASLIILDVLLLLKY